MQKSNKNDTELGMVDCVKVSSLDRQKPLPKVFRVQIFLRQESKGVNILRS